MGEGKSCLYVEGKDDKNVIAHVLGRHERRLAGSTLIECSGRTDVLESIITSVRATLGGALGFVLDANSNLAETWKAILSRLARVDVAAPDIVPESGFIGESGRFRARVGIWVMPDNRRNGALEDFLFDLVDPGDSLMAHAKLATNEAKRRGAQFNDRDSDKAMLHAWLAWQEKPGLPYGSAIRARFFQKDSVAARNFVMWFDRLVS